MRRQPPTRRGRGSRPRLLRRVGQQLGEKRTLSELGVSEREAQSDGEGAQVSRSRRGDLHCGEAHAVFGGRRRIRVYCDELNVLVPLCHAKCDKVTTLQLTTAYLRYIHRMHGDTFREVPLFVLYETKKVVISPHSG